MTLDKNMSILEGLAPIIGLRIREARTDKNMSQKELVGDRFSKSYISSIERGKITPSLKALEFIAKQLGVTVSYLLTGVHSNGNGTSPATILLDEDMESPARWDLLITEARLLREQHRYEQARNLLSGKVRVRQLNVEQLKQYHYTLALLYVDLDNTVQAIPELETARELAEKTGDSEMLSRLRQLLGVIFMLQGKPVLAIEQLRAALQIIDSGQLKDYQFQLGVYSNLGILHYQLGDEKEAITMYQEALKIAENAASPERLGQIYWNASQQYRDNGNHVLAKQYATKSLALYECLSNQRTLAQLRAGFGLLMKETKNYEQAEVQFRDVLRLASEQRDPEALTHANMNLADLYLEKGQPEEATNYSEHMLTTLDSVDGAARGQVLSSRACLLAVLGKLDEASEFFEQSVKILEEVGTRDLLSKVCFNYAGVLRQRGDAARTQSPKVVQRKKGEEN
jgi:tetratricopeptide (TPR) repeat protein/DNA-binding XRE family transcriptional regulator